MLRQLVLSLLVWLLLTPSPCYASRDPGQTGFRSGQKAAGRALWCLARKKGMKVAVKNAGSFVEARRFLRRLLPRRRVKRIYSKALERCLAKQGIQPTPTPEVTASPTPVPFPQSPQCNDGLDNDQDGAVDLQDAACQFAGPFEDSFATECQDGIDNDGDGLIDLQDFGCRSGQTSYENEPADVGVEPDYYACDCEAGAAGGCVPGDDANSGTSAQQPFRSYEKLRSTFNTLPAGATVAFCRGGSFITAAGLRWVNLNCRANQLCTIRDYHPPWSSLELERPIINATGNAFNFEDGGNSDHDEGYALLNLKLRGSGSGSGVFIYNDADDIFLDNLDVENFGLGIYFAAGNPPNPGSDAKNARAILRNSRIVNNTGQGFLGGSDYGAIENCYFENNGTRPVFDHNIYIGGATGMRIKNNELYRSAYTDGSCRAVSLVVHGVTSNLLIEGNLVREDVGHAVQGCWGIAVDNGYDSAESFPGLRIRNNTVLNVGNMSLGCGACSDAIIENNVIVHEQEYGTLGIAAPDRSAGPGDSPTTHVSVRNNTIVLGPAGGVGIHLGSDLGEAFSLTNNIIVQRGGNNPAVSCIRAATDLTRYQKIDYNMCHAASSNLTWAHGVGDLAAWSSTTGFDSHSSVADPLFTDIAGQDFSLSVDSPAIDAGDIASAAQRDFFFLLRSDGQPDLGAFEKF